MYNHCVYVWKNQNGITGISMHINAYNLVENVESHLGSFIQPTAVLLVITLFKFLSAE